MQVHRRKILSWDYYIGCAAYFTKKGELVITNSRVIRRPHGASDFVTVCGYDHLFVNIMMGGLVSQIPKKYVIRPKI